MKLAIHELTQSAELPLLAALLLGVLVAVNPCQLAINVSALTYMSRKTEEKSKLMLKGAVYVTGRILTYTLLGWGLIYATSKGMDVDFLRLLLSRGEDFLPYVLLLVGAFLLFRVFFHRHKHGSGCHHSGQAIRRSGPFGEFFLGMVLALAFCPESAIFYFGMMIPLAVSSPVGYAIPFLFAIAAAVPVLLISWGISSAVTGARNLEYRVERVQLALNLITGIIFILIGIGFLF
ncbi:MAG: sulfite exporter TauE/SafE family protein [Roseburia sp.]|nr:sulfite exporter TauE/SafE family protein [Roseburia sp.]